MTTTNYSYAYLVKGIKSQVSLDSLSEQWEKVSEKGYDDWCRYYYKSHIDAMIEAEGQSRPEFLNSVRHYKNISSSQKLRISKYNFNVEALHLYFFPFDIVLLAIEIDDTGNTLNDLTWGHSKLMRWNAKDNEEDIDFSAVLNPFKDLFSGAGLSQLYNDGNKFKLYQFVHIKQYDGDFCHLLYELATSSPIDCIKKGNDWMTPSPDYYQETMKHNIVSTFNNWTALALVDSFTCLSKADDLKELDKDSWKKYYFQLIYLRCIFEKTFCFSRNISYHQGQRNDKLAIEIAQMEKYYFYDNISHNFQPNLLYQAMAKGLGIKEERQELFNQIKEEARKEEEKRKEHEEKRKEREEKRINTILGIVSIFAVFSVLSDIGNLVMNAFPGCCDWEKYGSSVFKMILFIGVLVSIVFIYFIYKIIKRKK